MQSKSNLARTALLCFWLFYLISLFPQSTGSADTAVALINVSANVPTIFSVTARGLPGDLDLTPNVIVNRRTLGLFHFKYNSDVVSLTISSDTLSGGPEASGVPYSFQGGGFKVSIETGCQSVDASYNLPFTLSNTGTDIKSALSAALITGIEEDCALMASWTGTSQTLPKAGKYSMGITLTMVSN